jgi:hypothetical protein
MTLEEAKEILKDEIDEEGLFNLGWYIAYNKGRDTATLDVIFSSDELMAIAIFMKESAKSSSNSSESCNTLGTSDQVVLKSSSHSER